MENVVQLNIPSNHHTRRPLAYTFYRNCSTREPYKTGAAAWSKLVNCLKMRDLRPDHDDPGISFVRLKPGTWRNNENVETASAVALDIDNKDPLKTVKISLKEVLARISHLDYYTYSTHSHTTARPCYRLIFPLARDVSPTEWRRVWEGMNKLIGGHADPQTKDVSRFYYLPSCPAERANEAFSDYHPGQWLDPDKLLKPTTVFATAAPATPFDVNADLSGGLTAPPPPYSEENEKEITAALNHIFADDYDTWTRIGMALHWLGWGERGLTLWDEWSKRSDKYQEGETASKWASFKGRPEGQNVTLGSLFALAEEHGWTHRRKQAHLGNYQGDSSEVSQSLNDVGNAARFVKLWGVDVRYCYGLKSWLCWDGARWIHDERGQVVELAKLTARNIYHEAAAANDRDLAASLAKHAHRSHQDARLRAMIDLAKSAEPLPVNQRSLDADPQLLGVQNGVIDLKTGGLRDPRREDLITKQTPVDYDKNAQCPTWLAFLDRIMGGSQELVGFSQRAIGYTLTGLTGEQCLFFLHGSGANGKTTFLNVLKELLGDYASQCTAETLMIRPVVSGANNDIARLRGARLVASSEVEDGSRLAESLVKQLTGQDTITARHLYSEHFEFKPAFKLWIIGNHKPIIRGDDYAIWRRIKLIPFTITIPEEERDRTLLDKLRAELPGILNWAIEGCIAWQRHGLNPPLEVKRAVDRYRDEMDVLNHWIEDCCICDPKAQNASGPLYTRYKDWSEANGSRPMSAAKFKLKMEERGYEYVRTDKLRSYTGIKLRGSPA